MPETEPRFEYYTEWESIAVLPVTTFTHWWSKQIKPETRNLIRKAEKKGVEIREARYDDEFVRGMTAVFNETPIRQGRRFWHYGKDFETVKQQFSRYIFRERRGADGGDRDITLKFRHPDRYVAQDRNMNASGSTEARTKFEEDIKSPFLSLYSFSTRLKIDNDTAFKTLGDIRLLFADVADKIDKFQDNTKLAPVNRFTARELVLAGATLQVGKTPRVDAECGLIVWYDDNGARNKPVAVELSYRYGNKNEEYGGGVTRRAFETFDALQSKLTKWVDPESRTKTAFVYQ